MAALRDALEVAVTLGEEAEPIRAALEAVWSSAWAESLDEVSQP